MRDFRINLDETKREREIRICQEPARSDKDIYFDYELWVINGVVEVCGHPTSMSSFSKPCCNASIHLYGNSDIESARADFNS
jgi:hypothetical protein